MKTPYRTLAGSIGLAAIVGQYLLLIEGKSGAALLTSSVQFFSFFTILTNLLAAAAMLVPVVAPETSLGRFLDRPSVRTAIVGYIVIVGTVYYTLLRNLENAAGLHLYLEYVLHYVTPPLFVLDWLLFVPKGEVGWRNGLDALAYPFAYLAWTLAHGAVAGWYPYPFIDVLKLGYGRMLLNSAGLILAFLALELLLVALDRRIKQSQNKAAP
jgi:hypothetical protein